MSLATKAAACTSCGKRLNRKRWYYRNGQYFCKKRCWVSAHEKAATDAAKAEAEGKASKPAPAAEGQPTTQPAQEAQTPQAGAAGGATEAPAA